MAMSKAKTTKKVAAAKVKTVASVTTKEKVAEDSAFEALELIGKKVGKHNLDSLVKKLKSGQLEDEKFMAQLDNKQKWRCGNGLRWESPRIRSLATNGVP